MIELQDRSTNRSGDSPFENLISTTIENMSTSNPRRALVSVSDKSNLETFVKGLVELGFEIISTGGTRRFLEEAGVQVLDVSSYTEFPEIMNGRVKTLHPKVHGAILGRPDLESDAVAIQEHGIVPFELVVVNLYPFEQTVAKPDVTVAEGIDNIDIGGPSMVRSAAKNTPTSASSVRLINTTAC